MKHAHHRSYSRYRNGLLILAIVASTGVFAETKAIDCECRAPDGTMRSLGSVECVNIVGTKQLVRCEMSTNTPYWKKLEGVTGCPDA